MLSERDVELAHPEAFDFVWGNLPPAGRAEFNRHLTGCRYCQGIVEEYSDIGQIIKDLPPHVEPPADLEDRTVAAMVAALAGQRASTDHPPDAEDQAATRVYPIPEVQPPAEDDTRVQPRPQLRPPAEDEARFRQSPVGQPAPAETQAGVTHLPVWRRYRGRLAAVVAVAAAIITAAIVIPLSLGGGRITPAQPTVVISLYATTAAKVSGFGAATGRATARQDASGSWDITLTVQHLQSFGDEQWYECWYVSRKLGQVAPAGSFQVPASGNRTFHMTSAVDPRDFPLMEITLGPPSSNGAKHGTVVLSSQTL
jgi:hypothetical protein